VDDKGERGTGVRVFPGERGEKCGASGVKGAGNDAALREGRRILRGRQGGSVRNRVRIAVLNTIPLAPQPP
jgi:hypothetical protein